MRLHSEFHLTCAACGSPIVTENPTGRCQCGVEYRIEWESKYERKPEAK